MARSEVAERLVQECICQVPCELAVGGCQAPNSMNSIAYDQYIMRSPPSGSVNKMTSVGGA